MAVGAPVDHDLGSGDGPPAISVEFYFGSAMPTSAADGAVLDDGTGFAAGRDGGYDYSWDCDGDTDVNYAGGEWWY